MLNLSFKVGIVVFGLGSWQRLEGRRSDSERRCDAIGPGCVYICGASTSGPGWYRLERVGMYIRYAM